MLSNAAATDNSYVVAGCPAATWSLSYQTTALGTIDHSASGPPSPTPTESC